MKTKRTLLIALALLGAAACTVPAWAQTGRLNDTGQTSCYDASNAAVACSAATVGNSGTLPHQDGRYGRDAAAAAGVLTKTGGGAAGFDFSCVLWDGSVLNGSNCTAGLVANTTGAASGTPGTDWACTKDNVTGLVWSLQTQGTVNWATATGASYPNAGHNSANRCGYGTGWRLPTRRELLSILHRGQFNPAIDSTYFPATQSGKYWTSETSAPGPTNAWAVYFYNGYSIANFKTDTLFVRLVRSGP
ncbi:Lcl C-terminal domain-containing protein [Hydrogenophaga soli]